jgi:translation initiation factor 2-alpha kinase 4
LKDFDIVNCEKQYKIIKWLLDHNPFNRPTCAELIKSPLVPVIIEEQFLNEAIKSITTISNYPKLIASLFSRKPESHKDFSYDFNANNSQLDMQFSLIGTRIQEHCLKVFTRHGAVQLSAPLLMLKNDFIYDTETSKRPVQLMDSTGDLVQLPWDLTVPFARCISRAFQNSNHLETFKRFAIDPVYRPNIAGGQPKRILECDFDIVSRIPADRMAEAEGNRF